MGGRVSGASTCVAGSVRGRSPFPCPGAMWPSWPSGASSHLLSRRRARSAQCPRGGCAPAGEEQRPSSGAPRGTERTSDAADGRAGRLSGRHSPALRLVPHRRSPRWEVRGEGPAPCALNAFISPGRRWGRAGQAPWVAVALGVGRVAKGLMAGEAGTTVLPPAWPRGQGGTAQAPAGLGGTITQTHFPQEGGPRAVALLASECPEHWAGLCWSAQGGRDGDVVRGFPHGCFLPAFFL